MRGIFSAPTHRDCWGDLSWNQVRDLLRWLDDDADYPLVLGPLTFERIDGGGCRIHTRGQ